MYMTRILPFFTRTPAKYLSKNQTSWTASGEEQEAHLQPSQPPRTYTFIESYSYCISVRINMEDCSFLFILSFSFLFLLVFTYKQA